MTSKSSTRTRTTLVIIAIIVGSMAFGGFVAGQVPADPTSQSETYLRVVHASADVPAVDIYLDNESVATNASFGDVTQYTNMTAGTYNLTITEPGDEDAVLFEETITLDPRVPTTITVSSEIDTDNATTLNLDMFTDNAFTPGENDSVLSVGHLSPDTPGVTVTTNNGLNVVAENVTFRNASDYVTLPAGNYTLEIRETTDNGTGPIVATVDVSLEGGHAYTAWAIGYQDPGEDQEAIMVTTTKDASITVSLPITETPTETPTEPPSNESETI